MMWHNLKRVAAYSKLYPDNTVIMQLYDILITPGEICFVICSKYIGSSNFDDFQNFKRYGLNINESYSTIS